MILFYSEYCPHCRMLLDTIKRHDHNKIIKVVCIESLRAERKTIPPQIHSVPALCLSSNSKNIIYGKQVFDYLLLPGSGKLLVDVSPQQQKEAPSSQTTADNSPTAYSIMNSGLSDTFSTIDEADHPVSGMSDRAYQWTSVGDNDNVSIPASTPFQEETRNKKSIPDIDAYRIQRELDLKQNDINTTQLLPPSFTR